MCLREVQQEMLLFPLLLLLLFLLLLLLLTQEIGALTRRYNPSSIRQGLP